MADVKPSGLPTDTSLDDNHYIIINDPTGPTTKRTTLATFKAWLQSITDLVNTAMLASGSVTLAKLASNIWGWEILGRDSVTTGTKTSLDTGTFTAKKHIRIIYTHYSGGSTLTAGIRFNNDSGTNYAYRTNENGTESSGTNQTFAQLGVNALEGMSVELAMVNIASKRKVASGIESFWDTAGAIYRNTYATYWQNTANQVTRVNAIATGGAFQVGSEIIVLGKD